MLDKNPRLTSPEYKQLSAEHDDSYGTVAQVEAIEKQSAGPVQVCMLENCGHRPWKEQALISLEVISDFIAS